MSTKLSASVAKQIRQKAVQTVWKTSPNLLHQSDVEILDMAIQILKNSSLNKDQDIAMMEALRDQIKID